VAKAKAAQARAESGSIYQRTEADRAVEDAETAFDEASEERQAAIDALEVLRARVTERLATKP
jgi:hypothetical protein